MNLHDPRWQKTAFLSLLPMYGYWIGEFVTKSTHSTQDWTTLVFSILGIAVFSNLLLRDIWKSPTTS